MLIFLFFSHQNPQQILTIEFTVNNAEDTSVDSCIYEFNKDSVSIKMINYIENGCSHFNPKKIPPQSTDSENVCFFLRFQELVLPLYHSKVNILSQFCVNYAF